MKLVGSKLNHGIVFGLVIVAGVALESCGKVEKASLQSLKFEDTQTEGMGLKRVVDVFVGVNSTCARVSDESIKCWGRNDSGQLGFESPDTPTIGSASGQMGDALLPIENGDQIDSIQIEEKISCVVLKSKKARCWGPNAKRLVKVVGVPFDFGVQGGIADIRIGIGSGSICALTTLGSVKCAGAVWSSDESDKNNLIDNVPIAFNNDGKVIQIEAASEHIFCSVYSVGRVKCWGPLDQGVYGAEFLGYGRRVSYPASTIRNDLPFVDLGSRFVVDRLATGGPGSVNICALSKAAEVKCWGANNFGELGIGRSEASYGGQPGQMGEALPSVQLGTDSKVVGLSQGWVASCALFDNHKVKCWGRTLLDTPPPLSHAYPMGDNLPYLEFGGLKVMRIAQGWTHTCVILSNGGLKCWGSNLYGQLGLEDVETRGDSQGELGGNLPFVRLWDP